MMIIPIVIMCYLMNFCMSQTCNMHVARPMDRESDGMSWFTTYSTEECCAACLNNISCEAWTYVGSGAGACANHCHLKYAVGPVANYSDCCGRDDTYPYCTTGWAIIDNPICIDGDYIENTDFYGGDLYSFPTDGIGYCCYACTQTKNCIGFSYKNSTQHCYLKSSRVTPTAHDGITSYFFSAIPYYQHVATRILYFAYGAYCNSTSIESWTCKWCKYIPDFVVHAVIDLDDLQAYIGYDIDNLQIVVAFRGDQDWEDDINDTMTPYPGIANGFVNKGFYTKWLELESDILDVTRKLMTTYKNENVLITGHSLGAALAQLCALEIANIAAEQETNNMVYLYTYGSPRWGNLEMATYFADVVWYHYRLVNVHDAVPKLPSTQNKTPQYQYHHSWTEIWYISDEPLTYQQCDSSGEDEQCSYWQSSKEDHNNYLGINQQC